MKYLAETLNIRKKNLIRNANLLTGKFALEAFHEGLRDVDEESFREQHDEVPKQDSLMQHF